MIKESVVFGGSDVHMEGALKNPNQFRDAILYESLNSLSSDKVKEFVSSNEAKFMVEEGLMSPETLERLANQGDCILKTTICHMAKENGDPMWDELVRLHMQERRIMNDLIEKYADEAKPVAESAVKTFVEACVPEYFRK